MSGYVVLPKPVYSDDKLFAKWLDKSVKYFHIATQAEEEKVAIAPEIVTKQNLGLPLDEQRRRRLTMKPKSIPKHHQLLRAQIFSSCILHRNCS